MHIYIKKKTYYKECEFQAEKLNSIAEDHKEEKWNVTQEGSMMALFVA